jgi:uncharacterized protein
LQGGNPSVSIGLAVVTIAALMFALSHAAFATNPSFDCNRATTATEEAICSSTELSEMDSLVAAGYEYVRKKLGKAEAIRISRPLLRDRQACGSDSNCIFQKQIDAVKSYQSLGAPIALPGWVNETDTIRSSANDVPGDDGVAGRSTEICEVRLKNPVPNCPAVVDSPEDCFEGVYGKAGDIVTSPAGVRIMTSGYTYYCPSHEGCIALKDLTFTNGCVFTYVPATTGNSSDNYAGYIFVGDAAWSRTIKR